ncbi:hypothetical protein DFH09DRAFT_1090208 [Mycena vulgaris]|nr:hypothetical protein DFH09DRAFT_1090208 [Mycena vulgaris]
MADTILESLTASTLFDLRGVVAVVTGGGRRISTKSPATYNAASEKVPTRGRMYGLEGDVRLKRRNVWQKEIAKREKHVTVSSTTGINAGSYVPPAAPATAADYVSACFDNISQEEFTDVLNTNAVGPYWLTFAFLPLLESWKNSDVPAAKKFVPQVIMTSSMNGWTKDPATSGFSFPYLFSKSALGHATASLAHELIPWESE